MLHEIEHEAIAHGDPAPSCCMVIFGAGGDLTKRLLLPAIYNLIRSGLLPEKFALIAVDRLEMTSEMYREHIRLAISAFASDKHYAQQLDVVNLEKLLNVIHYQQGDFSDSKFYQELSEKIHDIQKTNQIQKNVVFYLAVAARFFGSIVEKLGAAQLLKESENSWRRVIVEKPFGHDVESSKVLNLELRKQLHERQIYRMDHFLGKETVQNIMMLRFSNAIFEPLWNREHIDHIQITVAETVGVEKRAAFYESTGAMRDMVPNHVFQLLALTTMEPPASFSADAVRNEKTKVLHTVHPINPERESVRAQYIAGQRDELPLKGYREEDGVSEASKTETYIAMKLTIDNWRWAGVPIYLRTGKGLSVRQSEIAIQFKNPPLSIFKNTNLDALSPNILVLKLQPDEGAVLIFGAKVPGPKFEIGQVHMDFHYKDYFQNAPSTGYETLVYDCMIGDATLFQRSDSVVAGWEIVQPLLDYWKKDDAYIATYAAGSEGPQESEELLSGSGRSWRRL